MSGTGRAEEAGEIYVSYAWEEESQRVVGELVQAFAQKGLRVIQDVSELGYKESIREFERRIGAGSCILLVISDKYLRSPHCLHELLEVDRSQNLRARIFPIVLPSARIYKPIDRLDYVRYWEQQFQELNDAIKKGRDVANLANIIGDLDEYNFIRANFDRLCDLLGDMNALTPAIHAERGYTPIIRAVQQELARSAQGEEKRPPEPDPVSGTRLRQIPEPPEDFTGRKQAIQALLKSIQEGGAHISGLQGAGGVGKTALACVLAKELRKQYPEQLLIDLRGTDAAPATALEVMGQVLHAYEPDLRLPEALGEAAGLYRSILDGRKALLLFDNARDAAQLAALLPLPSSCLALVTSRRRFALPGLHPLHLDTLPLADAKKLLLAIHKPVGRQAAALAELCGRLPMALRAAASLLAQRPDWDAEMLCRRLQDADQRLQLADPARGEASVRSILQASSDLLPAELRAQWAALAIFPASFDLNAAAAVWGIAPDPPRTPSACSWVGASWSSPPPIVATACTTWRAISPVGCFPLLSRTRPRCATRSITTRSWPRPMTPTCRAAHRSRLAWRYATASGTNCAPPRPGRPGGPRATWKPPGWQVTTQVRASTAGICACTRARVSPGSRPGWRAPRRARMPRPKACTSATWAWSTPTWARRARRSSTTSSTWALPARPATGAAKVILSATWA